ncbi:hypothetical protein DJ568_11955 [Mucilaginibacter hurinus]|uniref:Carboxypeptidase-like regulatory domain-containing protein n=1 Tax=Mucilaginibacter hurinus TaxID=2201324 RepID=A0A367GMJ0_9SPHI|nr:hypothetical protein [Mucilaginibacter hurinus]RCH54530.1 hypothetical protein DJ568_11955 [Mucilaginibacter hurinus]
MRAVPLLFILLCGLPVILHAQQTAIKGVVYKSNSPHRISQALVTNIRTNVIMMSDDLGMFTINVSAGDTLLISRKGYDHSKYAITNLNDIIVYLEPVKAIELEEVTVKGQTKARELTDVLYSYRSQGSLFLGKPPALMFLASPLTGLYELFGKTPKRARRFMAFTKAELEQDVVNRRYNVEFVKRVTGLNEEQAAKFMEYYTPSFEDMQAWNDYELVKRVKRQYQYYTQQKPGIKPLKGTP